MRCRVGDIAVIVGSGNPQNIGKFVEVLRPSDDSTPEIPQWECRATTILHGYDFVGNVCMRECTVMPGSLVDVDDQDLRPIRNPGEDAQDETLQWLPVPTKEIA